MKNVQGFSKCSTANEKFIWNEEDSIYGVDIPAWIQIINEADCKNEECADYFPVFLQCFKILMLE